MASYTKVPAKNKQGYKWICTLEGPPDLTTGKRQQIVRRGESQKEAYARAQEEYKKLKKGVDSKKLRKLTFGEVADEWLRTYSKSNVKSGSIIARDVQVKLLKKYLGDTLLAKITHRLYQNFFNDCDDEGYARNTMLGVNNTGNMIFKYALKNKFITENPATDVIVPRKEITVEEIENKDILIEEKYLDRSELKNFLETVSIYGLEEEKEIFYLLAFSGFRPGEMCALKWPDLDFGNSRIRITKTLLGTNRKKYVIDTPKTKKSVRIVPIDSDIMSMMLIHQDEQAKRRTEEIKLLPDYHDAGFVFRNSSGYPYTVQSVRSRMYSLLKKTDIKKHATPHIFRHTYVSMLAEAGVDLKTIMSRVGHEDEKTTLLIYTHVTKKMQQDADLKIKNHYADIIKMSDLQDS
ncbi:Transposase [compost metagenome]